MQGSIWNCKSASKSLSIRGAAEALAFKGMSPPLAAEACRCPLQRAECQEASLQTGSPLEGWGHRLLSWSSLEKQILQQGAVSKFWVIWTWLSLSRGKKMGEVVDLKLNYLKESTNFRTAQLHTFKPTLFFAFPGSQYPQKLRGCEEYSLLSL